MRTQRALLIAALAIVPTVRSQGVQVIDLLSPGDAGWPPPPNTVVADIYLDVGATDYWVATGFRAVTNNRAVFRYGGADDPNTPQPDQLIGPYGEGTVFDRNVTCFSAPRVNRIGDGRFNSHAGAGLAGSYAPGSPTAIGSPVEVNLTYFSDRKPGVDGFDGYIGRVALDTSLMSPRPDESRLQAGLLVDAPSNARFLMVSEAPPGLSVPGMASATFDVPAPLGFSWGIWDVVPEPSSLLMCMFAAFAIRVRR